MKRKDNSGGRPRIEEGDKKSKVTSFRTDVISRRHLERLTMQANKSISHVLRELVKNSVLEKSAYTEYLKGKTKLTKDDILGLIVINSYVLEALPKDLVRIIRDFYKASVNLNIICKHLASKGNHDLSEDYIRLKEQYDRLQNELVDFIDNYRNRKEVQV